MERIIAERNAELEEGEEPEVYEPLWDKILERSNNKSNQKAYIQALNAILPGSLSDPLLKQFFDQKFTGAALSNNIYSSAKRVVKENGGNEEQDHLKVKISYEHYRVEVITDATFDSITDGRLLAAFSKDIPQKGLGPALQYLEYVLH